MNPKSKLKLVLICAISLLTLSCNGSGGSAGVSSVGSGSVSGSASEVSGSKINTGSTTTAIYFENYASIPLVGKEKTFMIRLYSTDAKAVTLNSLEIIDPLTGSIDSNLATTDTSLCSSIAPQSNCIVKFVPHLQDSGSFILKAQVTDGNVKPQTIYQLIRVTNKAINTSGIFFKNDLSNATSINSELHMAIPVVLADDFKTLSAINGKIRCDSGFIKDASCTYFVDISLPDNNTFVGTQLEGTTNTDTVIQSVPYNTLVGKNQRSILIASEPRDFSSTNSNSKIVVFNSGNIDASFTSILYDDNYLYIADNQCSSSILEPGQYCIFDITGGRFLPNNFLPTTASLGISFYDDEGFYDEIGVNLYYISDDPFYIELMPQGDLIGLYGGVVNRIDFVAYNRYSKPVSFSGLNTDLTTGTLILGNKIATNIPACIESVPIEVGGKCGLRFFIQPFDVYSSVIYQLLILVRVPSEDINFNLLSVRLYFSMIGYYQDNILLKLSPENRTIETSIDNEGTTDFVVQNVSSSEVNLGSIVFEPPIKDLQTDINSPDSCSSNKLLRASESCVVHVVYSPKTGANVDASTKLKVDIAKIGGRDTSNINNSLVSANLNLAIRVFTKFDVDIIPDTSSSGVTSPSDNVYNVLALPGNYLDLTYTFTLQKGGVKVENFIVDTSKLPIIAKYDTDSSTCPILPVTPKDLFPGQSCTVIVKVPRGANTFSLQTESSFPVQLAYSWWKVDQITGDVVYESANTVLQTVNLTSQWLDGLVITSSPFTLSDPNKYTSIITVKYNEAVPDANVKYPIKVSARIEGNQPTNSTTCFMYQSDRECNISISIPKSFPANYSYVIISIIDNTTFPDTRKYESSVKINKK